MSTTAGFGTKYLGFSKRRPDGTHTATEWAVAILPVWPLRRHQLVVGMTSGQYHRGTISYVTPYRIVASTRLRPLEILATYLTWWVLVPGIAVGPIVLLNLSGSQAKDGFGPNLLAILWLIFVPAGIERLARQVRQLPGQQ